MRAFGPRRADATASRRRALGALLVGVALLAWPVVPARSAPTDDIDPSLDNPPGCTTAKSENVDGCGAQGRDHFANAGHLPPIQACATSRASSGSVVTRIVPDGPRRSNGSLAFISGACVYLPPGYESGALRYPVVYLLHGGGGDQADWVTFGNVRTILDAAYTADPSNAVIAVMPDGRSGQWHDWIEDDSFRIETYALSHLVPAVDARFRTIADRRGRAIAGLSNGGYGALHFAAKRPDLFTATGGMSSNLGARSFAHLGNGIDSPAYAQGNVPAVLAENLDEVGIILDLGGICGTRDLTTDLCATAAFDQLFLGDHLYFQQRMRELGHSDFDYRQTEGGHAWRWWTKWLAERDLPFLLARTANPELATEPAVVSSRPASWRYRSIFRHFTVWGYDVAVDRDVREFLDLRNVRVDGLEVQGSGHATITSAAGAYEPGRTYAISGATALQQAQTVVADSLGRLTIEVDLGPSHTAEQYSQQADIQQRLGNYWTVRSITIAAI